MNVRSGVSMDDPRLEIYRDLRSPQSRKGGARFVVEGRLLVERLLASDIRVESVLCEPRMFDDLATQAGDDVSILVLPRDKLREVVGYAFHRGALACGYRPSGVELSSMICSTNSPILIPVCIGVRELDNLGGIIRTSAAFGATCVAIGPDCADPFARRVARTSMGANLIMPISQPIELRETLECCRREFELEIVAAVASGDADSLSGASRATRTAILFGNESTGLADDWIEFADRSVKIPIQPNVDSLNVAAAASIFLYQWTSH